MNSEPRGSIKISYNDLTNFFRDPVIEEEYFIPVEVENQPKNIAQMKDFGSRLGEFDDIEGPVMNLQDLENNGNRQDFLRQNDPNEGAIEPADDDAIRCIPKVMQVSQSLYKNLVKSLGIKEIWS